jgi:hypothetical protein
VNDGFAAYFLQAISIFFSISRDPLRLALDANRLSSGLTMFLTASMSLVAMSSDAEVDILFIRANPEERSLRESLFSIFMIKYNKEALNFFKKSQ